MDLLVVCTYLLSPPCPQFGSARKAQGEGQWHAIVMEVRRRSENGGRLMMQKRSVDHSILGTLKLFKNYLAVREMLGSFFLSNTSMATENDPRHRHQQPQTY